MRVMRFDEFLEDFGRAAKPVMNMTIYQDSYECGCGKSHWFSGYGDIICEGFRKVMMQCPENPDIINSLKIKTAFVIKFKGFQNLASTKIETQEDAIKLRGLRSLVRIH